MNECVVEFFFDFSIFPEPLKCDYSLFTTATGAANCKKKEYTVCTRFDQSKYNVQVCIAYQ